MTPEAARLHLARTKIAQREFDDAEAILREILDQGGKTSEAICLLAAVHQGLGRFPEAVALLRQEASRTPHEALVWGVLADTLATVGDFASAIDAADQSLTLQPDNANLALKRINWRLNTLTSGARMRQLFEDWANRHLPPTSPRDCIHTTPVHGRKLRVGYVSGDLRRHPVFFFIAPYFHHHDHDNFEIHVFMTGDGDHYTDSLKTIVPHWHDVSPLSDTALLTLIRQLGIDVLVDLSGHAAGHRLEVFQRRAAPVQLTWFGTVATLGMSGIDHRITDWLGVPPGAEDFYVERPLRLEALTAYQPPHGYGGPHPAPHTNNGFVTMVSLNHDRKIGDEVLVLWRQILSHNPSAGLLIVSTQHGDDVAAGAFQQRLQRFDFPMDRVAVVGRLPLEQLMNVSSIADFALDSYPVSGGATTFHSLTMGLPIVCIRPAEPIALYGYTAQVLESIGLTECISETPSDYIALATQWIQNPTVVDRMRTRTQEALLSSPYMQHHARTQELEACFCALASQH